MGDPVAHRPSGDREIAAAHLSIAGALLIFAVSCGAGIVCDSIALMLDAGTGLVNLLMAFFTRGVIRKIGSPPDHRFNFGYGKYEAFAVAVQNFGIVVTCLIGIIFAVQDIIHAEDIVRYDLPAAAALFCGALALALGLHARRVSLRGGSSVLRSTAMQWFVDAGLSFGMCAGFVVGILLLRMGRREIAPYVDPVMAILLAALFMRFPCRVITAAIAELLDAVPGKEVHDRIRSVAEQYGSRACGIGRMRARRAGKKTFLDIGFIVHGGLTVREAAAMADDFERDLNRAVPGCDATVYFRHLEQT